MIGLDLKQRSLYSTDTSREVILDKPPTLEHVNEFERGQELRGFKFTNPEFYEGHPAVTAGLKLVGDLTSFAQHDDLTEMYADGPEYVVLDEDCKNYFTYDKNLRLRAPVIRLDKSREVGYGRSFAGASYDVSTIVFQKYFDDQDKLFSVAFSAGGARVAKVFSGDCECTRTMGDSNVPLMVSHNISGSISAVQFVVAALAYNHDIRHGNV